jgi:hypothetical protein
MLLTFPVPNRVKVLNSVIHKKLACISVAWQHPFVARIPSNRKLGRSPYITVFQMLNLPMIPGLEYAHAEHNLVFPWARPDGYTRERDVVAQEIVFS